MKTLALLSFREAGDTDGFNAYMGVKQTTLEDAFWGKGKQLLVFHAIFFL